LRVTIVGSGAIGGLAGAWMHLAGEDVLFVDKWVEHVDAMNRKGLRITGIKDEQLIKVKAATPEQIKEPLELLVVACKSQHTEEAIQGIRRYITPKTLCVSLQNGFNVYRIARNVPSGTRQVIGSVPDYGGALVDPGHLELGSLAPLHIGEMDGRITDRLKDLQSIFSHFTETILSDNIIGEIWAKQVYSALVVMASLVDASTVDTLSVERNCLMAGALVKEAIKVALAAGVTLKPLKGFFDTKIYSPETSQETKEFLKFIDEVVLPHWRPKKKLNLVKQASGMWWDVVYRKRKSETRWILGDVIAEAKRLGVLVPANEKLVNMFYEIEEGKRKMTPQNLDELNTYMKQVGCILPT
jgi:2-dehydropantoate 2-reductase